MKTKTSAHKGVNESILSPRVWREQAVALFDAFFGAVRVVKPSLPMGPLRATVLENGTVWTLDDMGDGRVNPVNPFAILREKGGVFLLRRLGEPLFVWGAIPLFAVRIFRRIKRDRAGQSPCECFRKVMRGHTPGHPPKTTGKPQA